MTLIRLQLALAKAGVASRRHAEELITAGRIKVNGKVVSVLGSRIDPVRDQVSVDDKPVLREPMAYYLLNKPKGYVTTASDPEGRPTVFELLPKSLVRLFSVGRLDYNTEGALLLTNDGELAHALMHPSMGVPKVYHAKFRGTVGKEQLHRLRGGVDLPPPRPLSPTGKPLPLPPGANRPERTAPATVDIVTSTGRHTWLQFILHEGKNRQIHRMAEAVGSSLLKLIRVEYAGLDISNLELNGYRALQPAEVMTLRQSVGLSHLPVEPGPVPKKKMQEPEPVVAKRSERPTPPARAQPSRSHRDVDFDEAPRRLGDGPRPVREKPAVARPPAARPPRESAVTATAESPPRRTPRPLRAPASPPPARGAGGRSSAYHPPLRRDREQAARARSSGLPMRSPYGSRERPSDGPQR